MMSEVILRNYAEYKEALDKQLKETAEGFVRIGYLLKLARDTDILVGSGYDNVIDFAKSEYGLDRSMVSRFIHINDRFAENGNSQQLKEQYRGFGYAKLAIMLQLPDEINEELSADYSKSEIQAIKDEIDEEKNVTDIEMLIEGEKEEQKKLTNLEKTLWQLCFDEPGLYVNLHQCFRKEVIVQDEVKDLLAPSGEKMYSVRIPGIGRKMLSLKNKENQVAVIDLRSGVKEYYEWNEVIGYLSEYLMDKEAESAEKSWSCVYNMPYPEKKQIAPVQQDKPVPRKESKVSKSKTEKPKKVEEPKEQTLHDIDTNIPKPEPIEENPDIVEMKQAAEEPEKEDVQIPGQDNISNHPEYMPEVKEKNTEKADKYSMGEAVEGGLKGITAWHLETNGIGLKAFIKSIIGSSAYERSKTEEKANTIENIVKQVATEYAVYALKYFEDRNKEDAELLKSYVDTGLSPENIREIDILYAEKCREVAELRKGGVQQ